MTRNGCGGLGALVFRDKMWLLGGWNASDRVRFPKTCNSEVWSSTDGADWRLETHAPWEGRHTAGYAVHDGRMWILGGDPLQRHYQNDVWSSDDGIHWVQQAADLVTGEDEWAASRCLSSRQRPRLSIATSGIRKTACIGRG